MPPSNVQTGGAAGLPPGCVGPFSGHTEKTGDDSRRLWLDYLGSTYHRGDLLIWPSTCTSPFHDIDPPAHFRALIKMYDSSCEGEAAATATQAVPKSAAASLIPKVSWHAIRVRAGRACVLGRWRRGCHRRRRQLACLPQCVCGGGGEGCRSARARAAHFRVRLPDRDNLISPLSLSFAPLPADAWQCLKKAGHTYAIIRVWQSNGVPGA